VAADAGRSPAATDRDPGGHDLVVEFVGDERVLSPGDELTFGRSADLEIDDNRYLHRLIGRFTWANGMWWLVNTGSSIALRLADARGPSYAKVAPGATVPLAYETAVLTFEAGGRPYELHLELLVDAPGFGLDPMPAGALDDEVDLEATTTAGSLPLNDEQRLLLVALCEPWLDDSSSNELPTNRQIAARLGWTITKYNRKLDGLCVKFAAHGVSGLRGSSDALARDRRLRLVDHALHAGVVTPADLALLDDARAR
jgi:hypothetical protein